MVLLALSFVGPLLFDWTKHSWSIIPFINKMLVFLLIKNYLIFKVWNSARTIRKALVVATYEEFQRKGREKLGLAATEPLRVVLEGDGTQVSPSLAKG